MLKNVTMLRVLLGAALFCGAAAGCSADAADGAGASGDDPASSEVEKNRMRWVLPLDRYMLDLNLMHVEDILVEECMRDNGFDYHRPAVDIAAKDPSRSDGGRTLFNVEIAKQWGYSGAPNPNREVLREAEAAAREWSPEQLDQHEACFEVAREELPTEVMRINNTVSGLAVSPWTGALKDPAVVAAAEEWVRCMQPLGFTDLGDSPHDEDGGTPTLAMSASYGEVVDGMSNEQTPAQEAEEIRLATFDAECQESSGYAQALYDAEWERQARVVAENEDALAALLEDKAAFEKQAQAILDGAGVE